MNASYPFLLGIVAPVFAVIAIGFALRRARWLTADADQSLLRVSINVFYPCLVFHTVLGNPAFDDPANLWLPPLVGFGTIALGFLIAGLATKLLRMRSGAESRTFAYTTGIYNYGYIPLPLVHAIFDKETAGVLFTHNLGVEVAFWTLGLMVLTGSAGSRSWRNLLNAPVLAIVAAVALNFLGAGEWLPRFVLGTFAMLAVMAVPVALLLTGATFADFLAPGRLTANFRVPVAAVIIRLFLLPCAFLLLARYLPAPVELKRIIVVQAAMPAAMLPIVFAKHYGGDTVTAVQVVGTTSMLAVLTIPFWLRAGIAFVGV